MKLVGVLPEYLSKCNLGRKVRQLYSPWGTKKHNCIETKLKVHVISSQEMGSGDRLPVLV